MPRARAAFLFVFLVTAACGHKIGDSCNVLTDCAQDGTRVCDQFSLPGGYCTVQGCDFGTCPDEAVCVRFFPALENATKCSMPGDCAVDEVCTVSGDCAPVSIEQRFCMLTCSSDGDCRDGYECRTVEIMKSTHGGEPVPDSSAADPVVPKTSFCASLRSCTVQDDCGTGEICDGSTHVCKSSK